MAGCLKPWSDKGIKFDLKAEAKSGYSRHSLIFLTAYMQNWSCTCTRCNHETALEYETANCTCCSNKNHDVNVVKDEQEIEEMKTVKKFE